MQRLSPAGLFCLLNGWVALGAAAAFVCYSGQPISHLRPPPPEHAHTTGFRIAAGCAALHALSWAILVGSGFPAVLPAAAARITLGVLLLLTMGFHAALCRVILRDAPWGIVHPTPFTTRNRLLAVAPHGASSPIEPARSYLCRSSRERDTRIYVRPRVSAQARAR